MEAKFPYVKKASALLPKDESRYVFRVTTFFHSTLTRTASPGTWFLADSANPQIPSHDIGCTRLLLHAAFCSPFQREAPRGIHDFSIPRASHQPAALCGLSKSLLVLFNADLYGYFRGEVFECQVVFGSIFRKYRTKFSPTIPLTVSSSMPRCKSTAVRSGTFR